MFRTQHLGCPYLGLAGVDLGFLNRESYNMMTLRHLCFLNLMIGNDLDFQGTNQNQNKTSGVFWVFRLPCCDLSTATYPLICVFLINSSFSIFNPLSLPTQSSHMMTSLHGIVTDSLFSLHFSPLCHKLSCQSFWAEGASGSPEVLTLM